MGTKFHFGNMKSSQDGQWSRLYNIMCLMPLNHAPKIIKMVNFYVMYTLPWKINEWSKSDRFSTTGVTTDIFIYYPVPLIWHLFWNFRVNIQYISREIGWFSMMDRNPIIQNIYDLYARRLICTLND